MRACDSLMRTVIACVWGMCGFTAAQPCSAQTVEAPAVVEKARELDNKTITLEGEVIGDIMVRGAYAWVHVLSYSTTMAVWIPAEAARRISRGGSFSANGDRVRITGIFHMACSEHGGDMDIHAQTLDVVRQGSPRFQPLSSGKKKLALRLFGVVVLLWIFSQLKIR